MTLKSHGINLSVGTIENIIRSPDKIEEGYRSRFVVQKGWGEGCVLRTVYEIIHDKISVIAIYTGRMSQYEED